MGALARNYGKGPVLLKDVAKTEEISEKYLGQIIIALKSGGLVKSFRGAHGGYALDREPSKITLQEVVGLQEGDLSLVDCVKKSSSCKRSPHCGSQEIWCKLSENISQTLGSFTLEDLMRMQDHKVQESSIQMYYI
jgi:Rrf2 family protein